MRKIMPFLLVLCLLTGIAVPISADDKTNDLPPVNDREEYDQEEFDNLVEPDVWGEVNIVSMPDEPIYPEDGMKDFEGEPLIAPYDPDLCIGIELTEDDWDGDGVPNDLDSCPTVYGTDGNGCPEGEDGEMSENDAVITPNPQDMEGGVEKGPSMTFVSIIAGLLLAAVLIVGMAFKKKR